MHDPVPMPSAISAKWTSDTTVQVTWKPPHGAQPGVAQVAYWDGPSPTGPAEMSDFLTDAAMNEDRTYSATWEGPGCVVVCRWGIVCYGVANIGWEVSKPGICSTPLDSLAPQNVVAAWQDDYSVKITWGWGSSSPPAGIDYTLQRLTVAAGIYAVDGDGQTVYSPQDKYQDSFWIPDPTTDPLPPPFHQYTVTWNEYDDLTTPPATWPSCCSGTSNVLYAPPDPPAPAWVEATWNDDKTAVVVTWDPVPSGNTSPACLVHYQVFLCAKRTVAGRSTIVQLGEGQYATSGIEISLTPLSGPEKVKLAAHPQLNLSEQQQQNEELEYLFQVVSGNKLGTSPPQNSNTLPGIP